MNGQVRQVRRGLAAEHADDADVSKHQPGRSGEDVISSGVEKSLGFWELVTRALKPAARAASRDVDILGCPSYIGAMPILPCRHPEKLMRQIAPTRDLPTHLDTKHSDILSAEGIETADYHGSFEER